LQQALAMTFLLASLPDDLINWRGTAAELAEKCNSLLPRLHLEAESGVLNERLVRYYVTQGVLTPPDREGREALFGFRQAVELLVCRYLLNDGWPLAKIAALVQSADLTSLQHLMPTDRPRTRAEEALARIRKAEVSVAEPKLALQASQPGRPKPSPKALALKSAARARFAAPPALEMAADLTRRKSALADNLKALGNADGRIRRQRVIRIEVAPWCQVHINAAELQEMTAETAEVLGAALTQALQEERSKRGEKA
jgi:DNA-binding transcriptional MerR regulator